MKQIFHFVLVSAMMFTQCTTPSTERKAADTDVLLFETARFQSELLSGSIQSEANTEKQQLFVTITIQNPGNDRVIIESINIETPEGHQAQAISQYSNPISLNPGDDTTMLLQCKPVNNFELFLLTGESGKFKALYYCTLFYKAGNSNGQGSIKTALKVSGKDFANYEKNYRQTVFAYQFNSANKFTEEQKKYLQPLLKTSPFVYVSNQEIAIAGLNFRLQSFVKNDSLYASLFIVNHADFSIKIKPDVFNVFAGTTDSGERTGKVEFKKISGLMDNTNMLRKGDRAIINFSKYVKAASGARVTLILKDVFLLADGHSLFYENPELEQL